MVTRVEDVPPDLVVDFDVHDPSLAGSVHERLAELQQTHPVAWSPLYGGHWLVTSFDDVHHVLREHDVFSAAENALPANLAGKAIPLQYDPPEHTAYRTLINPLFSPARMKALEPHIRDTAIRLIDTFIEDGEVEFVSAFAHPLPTATFLSLVGWPLDDAPKFAHWNEAILVGKPGAPVEDDMAYRIAVSTEVFEYFGHVVADRRANPDVDDVTGALMRARYAGERPLTDDEMLRALWLLMLGGLHTVRGVLALGMIHLAENPDQRQRLLDDPSLVPTAVEEMLRIDAPVVPGRILTRDVEFRGVQMREGDRIIAFTSAANRDDAEFACPHQLDVARQPNRHLTFGSGPHRCVGSHLARVELQIALEELHRRLPDYRLDASSPPVRHHGQVRGVNSLRLRFTPGQQSSHSPLTIEQVTTDQHMKGASR